MTAQPFFLAVRAARRMFSDFPELLMATSKSPGSAQSATGLSKTLS